MRVGIAGTDFSGDFHRAWKNAFDFGANRCVASSGDSTTSHSFINTTNGTFTDGAILLGRGVTQALVLGGLAFGTSPYLYSDNSNNVVWNLGSGGNLVIADSSGTNQVKIDQSGKTTVKALSVRL